jgi:site-specific recombinase XerD
MPGQKERKTRLPKTKTPEEWAAFFGAIDTRYPTQVRNAAALKLMYAVGLRVGETVQLSVKDLDLDNLMKVHVRNGKSGERYVPLPDDADLMKSMRSWLEVRARWNPDSDLLFVTKPGKPLSTNAIRESMKVYAERAGIGPTHPHQLRHSCATEILAHGGAVIGLQKILGHKSLQVTLSVYAHAADSHAREAMDKR